MGEQSKYVRPLAGLNVWEENQMNRKQIDLKTCFPNWSDQLPIETCITLVP